MYTSFLTNARMVPIENYGTDLDHVIKWVKNKENVIHTYDFLLFETFS